VPVDLLTADLSFISVIKAVPTLVGPVAGPGAPVVILAKPQFEAGRVEVSRGKGIIRDPEIHRRTLGQVAGALEVAGAVIMGVMPSPITGSAGNIEYLIQARTPLTEGSVPPPSEPGPAQPSVTAAAMVDAAVAEAHGPEPEG
jgi:23S rRNA (cytidine1920-2'-O)/16S rRNA (cytidine1409-2'-O)-methyltransferase